METKPTRFLSVCLTLVSLQATPVLALESPGTIEHSVATSGQAVAIDKCAAGFAPSADAPAFRCPTSEFPITNFERVNSVLLRGAVPSDKGLEALRDAGVKTVLNLRLKGESASTEELKVKKLGMNYVHFPLGFSTPDTRTLGRILRVIMDKQMQPVFVHCRQGADRTGMIVAIYRMLVDNWEFKDAYAEMRKHHFKPFLLVLKEAVRNCQAQGELLAAVGIDRGDNNKRLVGSTETTPEATGL